MRLLLRLLPSPRPKGALHFVLSPIPPYGRTAAYRRMCSNVYDASIPKVSFLTFYTPSFALNHLNIAFISKNVLPTTSRAFATSMFRLRDLRQGEEIKDPPREKVSHGENFRQENGPSSSDVHTKKPSGEESEDSPRGKSKDSSNESSAKDDTENTGEKESKGEEKPPPPPHGDKTPWQVFTETLRSEFQASKEWNESTKALASSAHQFSESESVKRARAAYSAASGAATSTTSSAFRGTGKALGQGAAWTWDTSVVKGVRSGVKATGRGIEKVTRPVRETQVYKTTVGGVKDVIDDGSSSRYGGWVEKEERRKQRELRELNGKAKSGKPGNGAEKIEEDPKSVTI